MTTPASRATALLLTVVVLAAPMAVLPTPTAAATTTTLDTLEDGDTSFTSGYWSGWTGTSVQTDNGARIYGTYSGELTSTGSQAGTTAERRFSSKYISTVNITVRGSAGSHESGDINSVSVRSSTGVKFASLFFQGGGNIEVKDGGTLTKIGTWSSQTNYVVRFHNFDYTADTFDITVEYTNGTDVATSTGVAFTNDVGGAGRIALSTSDGATTDNNWFFDEPKVTTSGSDKDASSTAGTQIDDFEDSDLSVAANTFEGWNGDTNAATVQTGIVLEGSHSAELWADANQVDLYVNRTSGTTEIQTVWFELLLEDDPGAGYVAGPRLLNESRSTIMGVNFGHGGTITAESSSGTVSLSGEWSPGVEYGVKIYNIDYSAGTYAVRVVNGGGTIAQKTGVSFDSQAANIKEWQLSNDASSPGGNVSVWYDSPRFTDITDDPSTGESQTITYQDDTAAGDPDWYNGTTIFSLYQADPLGPWTRLDEKRENWQGRATFDGLSNDELYRLTMTLEHQDAYYEVVGWKPGEKPDPWVVHIEGGGPTSTETATATTAGDDDPNVGTGSNDDGDTTVTVGDDDGIDRIEYNFTGPNGSNYEYNRTFEEPPDWYGVTFPSNETGIDDPSAWDLNYSVLSDGQWYNGTASPTQSPGGVITEPVDTSDGGGAGGAAAAALTVLAGVGYYYRKPQRRQQAIEAATSAIRRAAP